MHLTELTAAILQDRFFSANRPRYMNYGSLGFLIGHEITHGFDDVGRQYDFDGNLVNWWQPETEKKFLEKAQCIIWQYGNYTDLRANLSVTLNTCAFGVTFFNSLILFLIHLDKRHKYTG